MTDRLVGNIRTGNNGILLLFAMAFMFSAQTIKIQSLSPLPDEEPESQESTTVVTDIKNSIKDTSPETENTEKKISLKDFKVEKEDPILVKTNPVDKKNRTGSDAVQLEKQPNPNQKTKQQPPQKKTEDSQEDPSVYARKRNVHLKNYEVEEGSRTEWRLKNLTHFKFFYEKGTEGAVGSLSMHLESTLKNMRLKFPVFPSWINKESPNIYLYANKKNYLEGEFKPPEWSEGIALPEKKIVVIYLNNDLTDLKATITHELSHLYLRSFFMEKKKEPPLWLDEGIANYLGNTVYGGNGPWEKSMLLYPNIKTFQMPAYFDSNLDGVDDDMISYWYLQAYTIISFLTDTQSSNIKFKNFCSKLRDGKKETDILWDVYRFRNINDFQDKMYAWLGQKTGNQKTSVFSNFSTGRSEIGKNTKTPFGLKKTPNGFRK